jgi:hypothetical protein
MISFPFSQISHNEVRIDEKYSRSFGLLLLMLK